MGGNKCQPMSRDRVLKCKKQLIRKLQDTVGEIDSYSYPTPKARTRLDVCPGDPSRRRQSSYLVHELPSMTVDGHDGIPYYRTVNQASKWAPVVPPNRPKYTPELSCYNKKCPPDGDLLMSCDPGCPKPGPPFKCPTGTWKQKNLECFIPDALSDCKYPAICSADCTKTNVTSDLALTTPKYKCFSMPRHVPDFLSKADFDRIPSRYECA